MPKETAPKRSERTRLIIRRLKRRFPEAKTALTFGNPLQLLISTILSAQCTDVRVNMVTPGLFQKYPTARHFTEAVPQELEQDIRSTGFYRNKAKNIIGACRSIIDRYGGEVPATMEELVSLPGVGRKTANCVLGGAFGLQTGIVVDTHVERLAGRLGLSTATTPEKIELDLMQVVPKKDWYQFSNLMILHGRDACDARLPECSRCTLCDICPYPPRGKSTGK